uniref:EscU/YscU/HrcU family type III secretion system export apparatus switch protein n=1 Tax=Roseburia sp. TaxID=2049040 RepID=UPI003FEFCA03
MEREKDFRPNLWGKAKNSKKVIDPDKTAVALAYNPGDVAPKILAAGKGEIAERIIEAAKENDVPFYQDNKLADTLSRLRIGDTIPPELYDVVAEILVFVDDMDKMKGKLQKSGLI